MKTKLNKAFYFLSLMILLASCSSQGTSTIVGGEYNESKDETEYFVFPYGSTVLEGRWEKTSYNSVSRQQFFRNKDSVSISVAFGRVDTYEFNQEGLYIGYPFVLAYYDWDSKYLVDTYGLQRQILEEDSVNNFIVYRIYGQIEEGSYDTYFLVGEEKGNTGIFSIADDGVWSENKKVDFLKSAFLRKKT